MEQQKQVIKLLMPLDFSQQKCTRQGLKAWMWEYVVTPESSKRTSSNFFLLCRLCWTPESLKGVRHRLLPSLPTLPDIPRKIKARVSNFFFLLCRLCWTPESLKGVRHRLLPSLPTLLDIPRKAQSVRLKASFLLCRLCWTHPEKLKAYVSRLSQDFFLLCRVCWTHPEKLKAYVSRLSQDFFLLCRVCWTHFGVSSFFLLRCLCWTHIPKKLETHVSSSQTSFIFVDVAGHTPRSSKRTSQTSSFFVGFAGHNPKSSKCTSSKQNNLPGGVTTWYAKYSIHFRWPLERLVRLSQEAQHSLRLCSSFYIA